MQAKRQDLVHKLEQFENTGLIRILTGMRGSGKTVVLRQYQENLMKRGNTLDQFICIDLDDPHFYGLKEYHALHTYVESRLQKEKTNWVFVEQIQEVPDFERTLASLALHDNAEICVTASCLHVLSGRYASRLSGRYINIPVSPLSFQETLTLLPEKTDRKLEWFMENGGLPGAVFREPEERNEYFQFLLNTALLRDVVQPTGTTRVRQLEAVSTFLADHVSRSVKTREMADWMTERGISAKPSSAAAWVQALEAACLVHSVQGTDLKSGRLLDRDRKIYFSDTGLCGSLQNNPQNQLEALMKNVVFLELKRRGYDIRYGRAGKAKVDFVARRGSDIRYFQVRSSVLEETVCRETVSVFWHIRDFYPKIVISLDSLPLTDKGIVHWNLQDFLENRTPDCMSQV